MGQTGGNEVLLYSTICGGIASLFPFGFKEDADFFQNLEMHMRRERQIVPLLGRDHMAYRSYYFPCRNVIDGDLCEMFTLLKRSVQETIADAMDKTPAQVIKKIEDVRDKIF